MQVMRSRAPGFAAWIEALPAGQLPHLRALVTVPAVKRAVHAACAAAGLPPSPWRDMLAGDFRHHHGDADGPASPERHPDGRLQALSARPRLPCAYRGRGKELGPVAPEGGVARISAPKPGEATIFCGSSWPGEGCGLLHRSPPISGTGETRLLLVIDVPEGVEEECDRGQPQ